MGFLRLALWWNNDGKQNRATTYEKEATATAKSSSTTQKEGYRSIGATCHAVAKKARQVTTQFHKLTRQRDLAFQQNDAIKVAALDKAIEEMGDRKEYQRAGQVSTLFHSSSKWVLGYLASSKSRYGWLFGIPVVEEGDEGHHHSNNKGKKRKRKVQRHPARLLEAGAINTELLDEAKGENNTDYFSDGSGGDGAATKQSNSPNHYSQVRAIDIHSMHKGIKETDFLEIPVQRNKHDRYDVIVCSMVLNCVPASESRQTTSCWE